MTDLSFLSGLGKGTWAQNLMFVRPTGLAHVFELHRGSNIKEFPKQLFNFLPTISVCEDCLASWPPGCKFNAVMLSSAAISAAPGSSSNDAVAL